MSTQSPGNNTASATAKKVRVAIWVALITVVLVIAGVAFFANTYDPQPLLQDGKSNSAPSRIATAAPGNLTEDGGVVVNSTATKTTAAKVIVYIDFICPACQQFEKKSGAKLQQMAVSGDITLEYRPIAILDRASTSRYSSRALNAFACVADSKPGSAVPFLNKLMDEQPNEGASGLTNEKLAEHAASVSAAGLEQCITEGKFGNWTQATTSKALGYGLDHTPYVVVNDVLWDNRSDIFEMIAKSKVA